MARIVVLGAAGFLGSHLCDFLVERGDTVVGVDDLSSGNLKNLEHLIDQKRFTFFQNDICLDIPVQGSFDAILNFASPASPPRYLERPIHTLRTGSLGTERALEMSVNANARFIMASTSEVYGDPSEHPQTESYNGNVNPIGPRSCYDEAKRYSEALCMAYARSRNANVGIVRIFNTYGPRLDPTDGRVVSNFITQALAGQDITIYGDGLQTRSFCYVSDLVRGVIALLDSSELGPVNIGNPRENTMLELASIVIDLCKSSSRLVFHDLPIDDPTRRKPDIAKAMNLLNWQPQISLEDGLRTTIDWFYQSTN